MLYIFDIDGTLIEGFLQTVTCMTCKGEGQLPAILDGGLLPRPKGTPPVTPKCLDCKGKGFLFDGHRPYEDVVPLARRKDKIAELAKEPGVQFALATNQGGVAMGHQTERQVNRKLARVVREFGFFHGKPLSVHACMFHPKAEDEKWRDPEGCKRRKPEPGMLTDAAVAHNATWRWGKEPGKGLEYDAVYVGDLATDRVAAEAAGMNFEWAWEFFHTPAPEGVEKATVGS